MPISFEVNEYDQTVRIFNNFYTADLTVPSNEWEVVYSYFVGTSNPTTASAFASVLFRIAQESGVEVMTLLEDIQGKSQNNKLNLSQIDLAWVPLPAPGGPSKIRFTFFYL